MVQRKKARKWTESKPSGYPKRLLLSRRRGSSRAIDTRSMVISLVVGVFWIEEKACERRRDNGTCTTINNTIVP